MEGRSGGRKGGSADGQADGRADGRTDGWMGGRYVHLCAHSCTDAHGNIAASMGRLRRWGMLRLSSNSSKRSSNLPSGCGSRPTPLRLQSGSNVQVCTDATSCQHCLCQHTLCHHRFVLTRLNTKILRANTTFFLTTFVSMLLGTNNTSLTNAFFRLGTHKLCAFHSFTPAMF